MEGKRQMYVIKDGVPPSGDPARYDTLTIRHLIHDTDPEAIRTAGDAYETVAGQCDRLRWALHEAMESLASSWHGSAATTAITALRRIDDTAGELGLRSAQAAQALQQYGGRALPTHRTLMSLPEDFPGPNPDGVADGDQTEDDRDAAAQEVMRSLNEEIVRAWEELPDRIEEDLPGLAGFESGTPDQVPPGQGPPGHLAPGAGLARPGPEGRYDSGGIAPVQGTHQSGEQVSSGASTGTGEPGTGNRAPSAGLAPAIGGSAGPDASPPTAAGGGTGRTAGDGAGTAPAGGGSASGTGGDAAGSARGGLGPAAAGGAVGTPASGGVGSSADGGAALRSGPQTVAGSLGSGGQPTTGSVGGAAAQGGGLAPMMPVGGTGGPGRRTGRGGGREVARSEDRDTWGGNEPGVAGTIGEALPSSPPDEDAEPGTGSERVITGPIGEVPPSPPVDDAESDVLPPPHDPNGGGVVDDAPVSDELQETLEELEDIFEHAEDEESPQTSEAASAAEDFLRLLDEEK